MNKKILSLLTIPCLALVLGSCNDKKPEEQNPDVPGPVDPTPEKPEAKPIDFGSALTNLQRGFKATGTLKVDTNYFEDKDHEIPTSKVGETVDNIESILTYTNKIGYTGMDYKFNLLNEDGTKTYITSDNMFNLDGHLYFNSIGYDNILTNEYYAVDDTGNKVPYASNGAINPFLMVKDSDFRGENDKAVLSSLKANLVFAYLFQPLESVPTNINIKSNALTFKDNVLTSISFTSYPFNTVETYDYKNYYGETLYTVTFDISEVGDTDSEKEIEPEPQKLKNVPLSKALYNLSQQTNYRVTRHYKATDRGEPVQQEETVSVYFDGRKSSIYMQVFDYADGLPTGPSEADALLVDSNDEDNLLDAYMYKPVSDTEHKWQKAPELSTIDNLGEYQDFTLNNLDQLSPDIFDRNPDGSYSPIPQNLKFMAADIFVPFIATVSEIDGGYVNGFKLYLTEDQQNIDRIELTTKISTIEAIITLTYDQLNTASIPYDALNNIL